MEFVAIDFETANNFPYSICQIGIIKVVNSRIVEEKCLLVQPPDNYYVKWNILVHGITPHQTNNCLMFNELWPEISCYFENTLIVAHNAKFDIGCLKKTLQYYNLPIPSFRYECTLGYTGLNLHSACQAYDIQLHRHHDALCDARACAEIYLKILANQCPDLSKVKKIDRKKFLSFVGHERLKGEVLKPDLENSDPCSPFYNKKVVFTGVLNKISREEAAQKIRKMGADIDSGVIKKTDFIITGSDPGMTKLRKAEKYNSEGSQIKLIGEEEFLKMIS
jgi:DNA polymerase III subunit epsilon